MLGTFTHTGWRYSSRQLCNCVIGGVVLARRSSDHLAVRLLIVLTSPHSYRSPVDRVTCLSALAPREAGYAKRFRALAHDDGYCVAAILPDLGSKPTLSDCREMCGCNLVTPRLIGGDRRSSSGSLAMFTAMRRAWSRVSSLAAARRPGSSSK